MMLKTITAAVAKARPRRPPAISAQPRLGVRPFTTEGTDGDWTVRWLITNDGDRPVRRHMPDTRQSITHKFSIEGHEGYITVGLFEDNTPGELFVTKANVKPYLTTTSRYEGSSKAQKYPVT